MNDVDNLLREGIAAVKAGQCAKARALLQRVLRQRPNDVHAWLWLSGAVETDDERCECLEKVLEIDPNNPHAKKGLQKLLPPVTHVKGVPILSPTTARKPLPRSGTKTCPQCGVTIQEDRKFCTVCGTELHAPSAHPAPKKSIRAKRKRSPMKLTLISAFLLIFACISVFALVIGSVDREKAATRSTIAPTGRSTTKLTREQVFEARKNFKVEVISFDASQQFGISFPYSDYVRLRITNNSAVALPYLTVLTKRYDKSGRMIGSSRAPSIPTINLGPGESAEVDYYPKGHLPSVTEITVEIEQLIDEESMQFFKEFE